MRQLFRAQFKHRNNPIFLNYGKDLHRFTFLEVQLDKLDAPHYKLSSSPSIDTFLQKVKNNQFQLLQAQQRDFFQNDLLKMSKKSSDQNSSNTIEKESELKHQQIIFNLSLFYDQMQINLSKNLSKQNLKDSILALTEYNCIDLKIWQKVICFVSTNYKNSNLDERFIFMNAISEYLKKFEFTFNLNRKPAFKFMFPEGYISDLVDFRRLQKSIQNQNDFINQNDSDEDQQKKLLILQNMIYLIMKATKKADMNIYSIRQYFEKRIGQMIMISSRHNKSPLHQRLLYNIYFIYSYLNFKNSNFFQQLQKHYYDNFRSRMKDNILQKNPTLSVAHKSKQINKLLSIWKLNKRRNLEIYHEVIRPFFKFLLEYDLQSIYYSNICINLLAAGIKDHEIIHEMIQKCDQQKMKDDEFIHTLKHYLNVVDGNQVYESSYHKCEAIQNPRILKYLKDQKKPIFSKCLYQKTLSQKLKKQKSMQHHRIERVWSDVIKKVFQKKYEVIENAIICNYEIDFLIMSKTGILAIQIEGGHYNWKEFNKKNSEQTSEQTGKTGKKEIRQIILKAYDIKTVRIHCEQKLPTYIMQSRNSQLGAKYLSQRIKEQVGIQIENL